MPFPVFFFFFFLVGKWGAEISFLAILGCPSLVRATVAQLLSCPGYCLQIKRAESQEDSARDGYIEAVHFKNPHSSERVSNTVMWAVK